MSNETKYRGLDDSLCRVQQEEPHIKCLDKLGSSHWLKPIEAFASSLLSSLGFPIEDPRISSGTAGKLELPERLQPMKENKDNYQTRLSPNIMFLF